VLRRVRPILLGPLALGHFIREMSAACDLDRYGGMSSVNLILCELSDPGLDGLETLSPFCLKVHRALRAARLRYERRHAHIPAAFKRYNRTGQVPVLLVDDDPVADSTEILGRIVALAPGALSTDRDAWLWEELADTALNGFVNAARWADDRNWPAVRAAYFGAIPAPLRAIVVPRLRARVIKTLLARDVWRAGAERCWARFAALIEQLEARAPEHGFWCGRAISVADVALFGQLHSLRTTLTQPQCELIAHRRKLSAWLDRVHEATATVEVIASTE
jgi:glutathione S-transferase